MIQVLSDIIRPKQAVTMSPVQRIISNFKKVFGGQVAVTGISFVTLAVNTRALGVEAFGILVTIEALCQLIAMIAAFQTWQAMTRFGAQAIEEQDRIAWRKYMKLGVTIDLIGALFAGSVALGCFAVMQRLGQMDPEYRFGSYYFTIIAFTAATGTTIGILRVTNLFGVNIGINIGRAVLLLIAALMLDFHNEPLTSYLIVIPSIMALTNIALLLAGVARGVQQAARLRENCDAEIYSRKSFLGYALTTSIASTMNAFRQRGELLLVSWFLGSAAAGLYAAAYRSAAVLSRFAEAGRQSVYPEFAKLITGGNSAEARRIAVKSTRSAFLVALPIFLSALFWGDLWLTLLGGQEFARGQANLIWLCLGTLAYTLTFGLGPYVQIGIGPGRYLQWVCVAFALFVIGAIAGPLWLGVPGAGMGAGVFGIAMVLLLYRQIFAVTPKEIDARMYGKTVTKVPGRDSE